jgi:D,D-heptose 1,7-bisphosphate phosphatase
MFKAVFIDRDGVITEDPPHYAHRLDQLQLIPKSMEAIKILNDNGFKTIVVSNQSGVAKGFYGENDVHLFNNAMTALLAKGNAFIDAIYYCPHHPEAEVQKYRVNCDCRKPKPGMLIKAEEKFNINFKSSFLVGDKWSDIEAGRAVGCKTILVKTGHGLQEYENKKCPVDYVAGDLLDGVQNFILRTKK